jgi:hypothetical protein
VHALVVVAPEEGNVGEEYEDELKKKREGEPGSRR